MYELFANCEKQGAFEAMPTLLESWYTKAEITLQETG
jgi:hypothetical protein